MGWLLFEVLLALFTLLFIVWWTWPKSSRKQRDDSSGRKD